MERRTRTRIEVTANLIFGFGEERFIIFIDYVGRGCFCILGMWCTGILGIMLLCLYDCLPFICVF